ncbi:hypothetical protein M3S04_06535 [Xanthomonas sp. PPL139]
MSTLGETAGQAVLKARRAREVAHREQRVHGQPDFRLGARRQVSRQRLEHIHLVADATRPRQEGTAGARDRRAVGASVKKRHAKLLFHALNAVAHQRLRLAQCACRSRKTSVVGCRDENAQLIERERISIWNLDGHHQVGSSFLSFRASLA